MSGVPPWRTRARGFTLGELMVTVLIVMVVATLAGPSYQAIMRNARLTTQIHDFSSALHLARSEAVKRGYPVTVCPSTDQASCGAAGTRWEQGWIVFVDVDSDRTVDTLDAREALLRATPELHEGYTLRGSGAVASFVTANPKGELSGTGHVILCEDLSLDPSRAVLLSAVGRIAIAEDHDGVPVAAAGEDLTTCTPT